MRTLFVILLTSALICGAQAGGYDPKSFASYAALPEQAKPLFERLARSEFSEPDALALAKIPEAETATFEVLQRLVGEPDNDEEFLHYVTRVLRLRDDFSPEHQRWVRDTLRAKLGRTDNAMDLIFKTYGAYLLEKYPNPENEQLMIDYLQDKNIENVAPGASDIGNSSSYADVLCRFIGSKRSIGPLRKYAEQFKPETWAYKELMQGIELIEVREKQREAQAAATDATRVGPSVVKSGGKTAQPPQVAGVSTNTPEESSGGQWIWLGAALACLAAAMALSLKSRRR
jgi:hypothetical protein